MTWLSCCANPSQECLRRKDELLRLTVAEVQQEVEATRLKLEMGDGSAESRWRQKMQEVELRLKKVQQAEEDVQLAQEELARQRERVQEEERQMALEQAAAVVARGEQEVKGRAKKLQRTEAEIRQLEFEREEELKHWESDLKRMGEVRAAASALDLAVVPLSPLHNTTALQEADVERERRIALEEELEQLQATYERMQKEHADAIRALRAELVAEHEERAAQLTKMLEAKAADEQVCRSLRL
eukprot:scaffold6362_cov378-Prasinococcus_capsulatus_cf.AAC.18